MVDNSLVVHDSKLPRYDKLAKVRWFVDAFHERTRELYNSYEMLTINKMIVPCKCRYCSIWQFLRNKPIRFGIKIWAMVDLLSKYVIDVAIYEGKGTTMGEKGMEYEVVRNLTHSLEQRWHMIICNNLFTSPRLFHNLMLDGSWATRTLRLGRIGVPKVISQYPREVGKHGGLVIKMHAHRQMTSMA